MGKPSKFELTKGKLSRVTKLPEPDIWGRKGYNLHIEKGPTNSWEGGSRCPSTWRSGRAARIPRNHAGGGFSGKESTGEMGKGGYLSPLGQGK